ncbi:predicted protein [Sclerotinia sclerotiorum 1980 UF-70]|uniref:Uncharacterized protein n=1 Tax=Sclerotinia sclerotiorum (strain ATCC 18683 / 1980 / Ss-1) TaxID=665079 RepID=A7EFL9_SCLS1|nr:predicted protein [Sclerotinia sclerotiorum 1980 UF-70]EDO01635.1 predicted protein [Sclerotinia sclerotiorum 1980 UF-70]
MASQDVSEYVFLHQNEETHGGGPARTTKRITPRSKQDYYTPAHHNVTSKTITGETIEVNSDPDTLLLIVPYVACIKDVVGRGLGR